jgi:hypothetical protein
MWFSSLPAYGPKKEYADIRQVARPRDVYNYDKPSADSERYLGVGNASLKSRSIKGTFVPGHLLGNNVYGVLRVGIW